MTRFRSSPAEGFRTAPHACVRITHRSRGVILWAAAAALAWWGAGRAIAQPTGSPPGTPRAVGSQAPPLEVLLHGVDRGQQPTASVVERPIRLAAGKSVIVELVEKGKKEPLPIVRTSVGIKEIAEAVVAAAERTLDN